MDRLRVAFLGFGGVGRALHALLERRREALAAEYGVELRVTGVASRRLGWLADSHGVDPRSVAIANCHDINEWLARSEAEVVFEAIPLDPFRGQPAIEYLTAALEHGAHAISANKGPVVHAYRELTALAQRRGLHYRFESAVMDGAPLFSLVRDSLPLAGLYGVRGVFTSTATIVLESVERGSTFADGIAEAQRLGIAEADPTYDVDGWDSAVKLCAIANVLFGASVRPGDVARRGVTSLPEGDIRAAAREGRPYRLVGELERDASGAISAVVEPVRCDFEDALGIARGATLVTHFRAEVFPGGLTITSRDPDPTTTAYGMLADLLAILSPRRESGDSAR
jgi:homoserine dehydrogenase